MTTANATRNVQLLEVQRPFSPVQWAAVLGSLVILLWSVPGLINGTDALLHFATAAIFLAGAANYFVSERRSAR